jgi:hypothetical protein
MPIALSAASAAMHGAMVPIAYTNIGGSQIADFQNIPQTYQDLFVVVNGRSSGTANITGSNTGTTTSQGYIFVNLNNEGSSVMSQTNLYGNGATAYSNRLTNELPLYMGWQPNANATTGIFGANQFHFLNYTNSSTFKTVLGRTAVDLNGSGSTLLNVGLWRRTDAINRIQI